MRDAAYSSVTQNVDLHLENYDPFTDESCPPSWQEKFKFTSRTLLKEDLKAFDDAIKNLKNFGLKRRHLFTVTHDFSLPADDMFDALFPSRRVRCDNEEISKHLLYRLVSLDKTLQSDKALQEKISHLIGNGFMNFDMLLKVYGEIIKQAIQEKKSAELTEELQALAQENFSTWLNQWQSFCEKQSEENVKKLKTLISCGIPHELSKAVEQQAAAEKKQVRDEQQRQAANISALRNQPPSQDLQYSNPYVEAIFRGISKDRHRKFFRFDKEDPNAVPDCIHIGLTTNGDSERTAQEMSSILSTGLFQASPIKSIRIYWEDKLDNKKPFAINELLKVATALPRLESIHIYSNDFSQNIIRDDQIDTLLEILRANPNIHKIYFESVSMSDKGGYKKILEYWEQNPHLEINIDVEGEVRQLKKYNNYDYLNKLLKMKASRALIAPTEKDALISWEHIAPLAKIEDNNHHDIDFILEMERNSSAEQKLAVSDVLPENEPPSSITPRIFDITRLKNSFSLYASDDLTETIKNLGITPDDENRHQLVDQLIRVFGVERIQFFKQYNKLDALIDFVQTGRFSLCEIAELDKTSNERPLSRLSSLLAPYNNPLVNGQVLSAEDIQNIVDYETRGLNPTTRFAVSYNSLTPEQQKLIGHLQLFFDTVIVPSVKERIRLTQDWQQLRTTEGSEKEALIVEQKMGLFTDFIQKSCKRLSMLSVTIENSIDNNEKPEFKAQPKQYLDVVHSHRDAMNKTAGFAVSTEPDKKVLQEARHPVTFRVRQFFAAIASIPAGILGILTGFQLYSVNDMRTMFATKSHATLFTAQSKAQEIEDKFLDKPHCFALC